MKPKVYAYFLPQFYSIPENDKYWGKGFTEWTNVKKATPLFEGHQRPLLPVAEDYYDLSDLTTVKRVLQNTIDIGLDGIAYWYYWFGEGKRALTKVPEIHLNEKSISQNFFFAWSNNNWTKEWIGDRSQVIFKQKYNLADIDKHVDSLMPYFEDERYIKWEGQPLFQLNEAHKEAGYEYIFELENRFRQRTGTSIRWIFPSVFMSNELTSLSHFVSGYPTQDVLKIDYATSIKRWLQDQGVINKPVVITNDHYLNMFRKLLKKNRSQPNYIPCILSGWDNTYRYDERGYLISGSIEELIKGQMEIIKQELNLKSLPFFLIKAYNEWAEGNILENYELKGKKYDLSNVIHEMVK